MKYYSGRMISVGDRIAYNGQQGTVALVGRGSESGCAGIRPSEWTMNDSEIFIRFDNGALLKLDHISEDELLVFVSSR